MDVNPNFSPRMKLQGYNYLLQNSAVELGPVNTGLPVFTMGVRHHSRETPDFEDPCPSQLFSASEIAGLQ